ncbi:hypothetical protein [Thalassovita sp.]|uniref:hypothetical protein n=1 Tax=Thalassovita sp. TaxID=1979401 RepID=UPI002B274639|nr:hypothetical protein [Thalassovita sp.]
MTSFIKEALELGTGAAGLISGSTTAIKGVLDLVRKPNPDMTEIKFLAADAVDKLLEAKQAQMAMQDKILELENELKQRDRFQEEAKRYTLTKTDMGGFVYTLKPSEAGREPQHDLCASCFERDIKSVLQPVDFNTLECPRCKARVFKGDGQANVMYGAVQSGTDWSGF